MKTLGNILWIIFGGFLTALGWVLSGIILCVTIIGIPMGVQCFKIAGFAFLPFGKDVYYRGKVGSLLMNILWIALFGWELALTSFLWGVLCCITIIGIPFGKQFFKLAQVSFAPFGTEIIRK